MRKVINLVTQMEAGGAQSAAIWMSAEMRRRGIEAETWFMYKKSPTFINEEGVKVIYDGRPANIYQAVAIVWKIYKLFKESKPDCVITHTYYASVLGHLASKMAGVKSRVSTMHNLVWSYPRFARFVDRRMGAKNYYTKIIAVSEAVKNSCAHYPDAYKKKIAVVYNGVPARVSGYTKEQARVKFNLAIGSERLLVNVGRLHPQKNQKLLIKMMPLLPGYHLAIAGVGALKDELRLLIKQLRVEDRVHLMGELKPSDIPDFLRCGDVFVFSSIYEAFGIVIFEAAFNGLPIIASNIQSNIEVLNADKEPGEEAGIIVPDANFTSWVNAVLSLEDPALYKKYAERIKERCKAFNFDAMVDGYIHYSALNS